MLGEAVSLYYFSERTEKLFLIFSVVHVERKKAYDVGLKLLNSYNLIAAMYEVGYSVAGAAICSFFFAQSRGRYVESEKNERLKSEFEDKTEHKISVFKRQK